MLKQLPLGPQRNTQNKNLKRYTKSITNPNIDDPVVGSPKVEAEVTSQPLQLQVHKEVPKVKRVTHSSAKKETPRKGKDTMIFDLDPTKKI